MLVCVALGVVLGSSAAAAPIDPGSSATRSSSAAAISQINDCRISIEDLSPTAITVDVLAPVGVGFIQAPAWKYTIVDPDGRVVASHSNPVGSAERGPKLDLSRWAPGEYRVTGTLHDFGCSTTFLVGGPPTAAAAVNQAPVVSLDCPATAIVGFAVTLEASVSDPDGEIVKQFWTLPDGTQAEGAAVEWTVQQAGANDFAFVAIDDDDRATTAECRVLAALAVIIEPPPTPEPPPNTPTPPPATAEPTATSVPNTPEPAPTATAQPEPTATAQPAPTATAQPEPDEPTATPEAIVVPEPIEVINEPDSSIDPAPAPADTSEPEPTRSTEPTEPTDPGSGDGEPDCPFEEPPTTVRPGLLEARWPETLIVGRSSNIEVRIMVEDWRCEADQFNEDNIRVEQIEDENRTILAVIGPVGGRVELTLQEIEEIEIQSPATDTVVFQVGTSPTVRWRIKPRQAGTFTLTIRAVGLEEGRTSDPPTDAELAAISAHRLSLSQELTVTAEDRTEWLGFSWWQGLPLLLLPWFPPGRLGLAARRRGPSGDGDSGDLPSPVPADSDIEGDVGLAFSGGGLRATAFALGVAMYVAEADQWRSIRQISSVSGGSMTNAFVGHTAAELGRVPRSSDDLAELASAVATRGLPLERTLRLFAATLLVGCAWIIGVIVWAAPSVASAIPPGVLAVILYCLVCWLILGWVGVRPAIARWIPNFTSVPGNHRLRALGAGAIEPFASVFTATTTDSDHVHLSPQQMIITSPDLSIELADHNEVLGERVAYHGVPRDIRVAQAVQASAAFPGLPRIVLDADSAGFAGYKGKLALRDGGTSDNLGHISQTLFAAQSPELQSFLTGHQAIKRWVIVDSSAHRTTRSRRPGWILRVVEALNLGAAADLAEMAGTSASEQTATSAAQLEKHLHETGTGVYLALRISPFEYARQELLDSVSSSDSERLQQAIGWYLRSRSWPNDIDYLDDRGRRAQAAFAHVVRSSRPTNPEPDWGSRRTANSEVPTTLSSLGEMRTAELARHGYVLAAVACHIEMGWPLPQDDEVTAARFDRLVRAEPSIDVRDSHARRRTGSPVT